MKFTQMELENKLNCSSQSAEFTSFVLDMYADGMAEGRDSMDEFIQDCIACLLDMATFPAASFEPENFKE